MSDSSPPTRDDPESMFTPEQNYARNQAWSKPGPYTTELTPAEGLAFKLWLHLRANHVVQRLGGAGKWFGLPPPPDPVALTPSVPQITVPPVDATSTAPLKAMSPRGP